MTEMIEIPTHQSQKLNEIDGIRHAFFGRRGGVSMGLYDSLNVGQGSDDDSVRVAENRLRVQEAMQAKHLQSVYQVHSPNVITLKGPLEERPEGDAMVTDARGLALCIVTADCVPILFADRGAQIVGAAHAGWKGALHGVAENTVEAMIAKGANPKRIRAAIGPCIGEASYEVGPEYQETILDSAPWAKNLFRPGKDDRLHFNIQTFVKNRLMRLGLEWVDVIDHDTCAMEDVYYSNRRRNHRGEPDYGRNASVIMLTG